ncbi:MAG: D-glycerate dehydrogenase [Patescibacteria group bacterium]|nr:D-glycerate dehydrogenase [Patescibacteria group bacterium]
MKSIFVTRKIHEAGLAMLKKAGYKLTIYPKDQIIDRKTLLAGVKGKDAVLSLLTDPIDEAVFKAAGPKLKIVANYAVGFDNVDLKAAQAHKVVVTNTPSDKVNESVAEHTFALMLALAHRIPEADHFAKRGLYKGWSPTLLNGTDLNGKTLGLIGAGRIGSMVARHAVQGFGMKLLYSDMRPNEDLEKNFGGRKVSQDMLLKKADFISLHVPLLPSTIHLMSTKQFNLMKKTAFLINTARGPVVDEKALLKALRSKKFAGAALDVFECEPAIDCDLRDNLELKSFENVILTPHIASATEAARRAMSEVAAQNIIAVLKGKKPLTPAKV